jgi:magnesium-transporting ATPase (P-type)
VRLRISQSVLPGGSQEALHSKNLAFNSAQVTEGETSPSSLSYSSSSSSSSPPPWLIIPRLAGSLLTHNPRPPAGKGLGVVVRTGDHTMIGSIATLVGQTQEG